MPNPFPGMDPFIEDQRWSAFHHQFIGQLGGALNRGLRPRYVAVPQERVYFERHDDDQYERYIIPDVFVARPSQRGGPTLAGGAAVAEPEEFAVPVPHEIRESFLELRKLPDYELVALIEVLSPFNKRRGSDGHRIYLEKRMEILGTATHLVEIDLLRGGDRMPLRPALPPTDYCVMVSPGHRRARTFVYRWTLRQPLPTIAMPLAKPDPDYPLDLQFVLGEAYELAGFDYSLNRSLPVVPTLSEDDAAWTRERLAAGAVN